MYGNSGQIRESSKQNKPEKPKPDLLADHITPFNFPPIIDNDAIQFSFNSKGDVKAVKISLPESKLRRKLELRLLQNFIENTSQTFSACHNAVVREAWANDVPKVAFEHDNLLNQVFAISCLHLLRNSPDDADLTVARQAYLSLSLNEQCEAVSRLDSSCADAVCLASSLILIDSFASLRDRPIVPYTPPLEWLQLARGAGSLYGVALSSIHNFEHSRIMNIAMAEPVLNDERALFAESNRAGLMYLLSQDIPGEIWEFETEEAYKRTLAYLGGIQIAVDRGEHKLAVLRRMMAFALFVPKKFIVFVAERKPRALVILAHFFALASNMEDIWWVGHTIRREVQGLWGVLPLDWLPMMRKPLVMTGLCT